MMKKPRAPRVDVYWNLHRRCWSIRLRGKVYYHTEDCVLDDVEWVVQPAGQAKVRRERRKTVHAFARGTLRSVKAGRKWEDGPLVGFVKYDPYTNDTFRLLRLGGDEMAVQSSERAILTTRLRDVNVKGHMLPEGFPQVEVYGRCE